MPRMQEQKRGVSLRAVLGLLAIVIVVLIILWATHVI